MNQNWKMYREKKFKAAWWARSPHMQTLAPVFFRRRPRLDLRDEQYELPDGDFLDLCWSKKSSGPFVLILHGLEGSIKSHYAGALCHTLEQQGYRPVFMHFRGCSGRPNRLARAYHSGDTADLASVVSHITDVTQEALYAAIGFSLGGNVLCKWLGETGSDNPLKKAVAVSAPYQLGDAAKRLEYGISRIYREHLMNKLRSSYKRKFSIIKTPLDVDVDKLHGFWDFDDKITAPLHGFDGADHYYATSSCRQYLSNIRTPTQLIHALDDPFMFPESIPTPAELSSTTHMQLYAQGGHVGFIAGSTPWNCHYQHETAICQFLKNKP